MPVGSAGNVGIHLHVLTQIAANFYVWHEEKRGSKVPVQGAGIWTGANFQPYGTPSSLLPSAAIAHAVAHAVAHVAWLKNDRAASQASGKVCRPQEKRLTYHRMRRSEQEIDAPRTEWRRQPVKPALDDWLRIAPFSLPARSILSD
jgi:hypothetical protein